MENFVYENWLKNMIFISNTLKSKMQLFYSLNKADENIWFMLSSNFSKDWIDFKNIYEIIPSKIITSENQLKWFLEKPNLYYELVNYFGELIKMELCQIEK